MNTINVYSRFMKNGKSVGKWMKFHKKHYLCFTNVHTCKCQDVSGECKFPHHKFEATFTRPINQWVVNLIALFVFGDY